MRLVARFFKARYLDTAPAMKATLDPLRDFLRGAYHKGPQSRASILATKWEIPNIHDDDGFLEHNVNYTSSVMRIPMPSKASSQALHPSLWIRVDRGTRIISSGVGGHCRVGRRTPRKCPKHPSGAQVQVQGYSYLPGSVSNSGLILDCL